MSPRTVFSPYARLFTVPGSRAFSAAGWVGRLPAPMLGLGAVFLVEGATGSYGLAGAVSGTLALSYGLAGPQWARAMDRRGQAPADPERRATPGSLGHLDPAVVHRQQRGHHREAESGPAAGARA